jgi:hypothetical protein
VRLELDEIEVVTVPAGHPLNTYVVDVQLIRLDGFVWLRLDDDGEFQVTDFWNEITSKPYWLSDVEVQNYLSYIDRHYLVQAHGELFGSVALQNGAL